MGGGRLRLGHRGSLQRLVPVPLRLRGLTLRAGASPITIVLAALAATAAGTKPPACRTGRRRSRSCPPAHAEQSPWTLGSAGRRSALPSVASRCCLPRKRCRHAPWFQRWDGCLGGCRAPWWQNRQSRQKYARYGRRSQMRASTLRLPRVPLCSVCSFEQHDCGVEGHARLVQLVCC